MENSIVKDLENLKNYSWLPERAEDQLGIKTENYKEDEFGIKPRFKLIKNKLSSLNIKNVIDIGGNSGYFSLELLDKKVISKSSVYDVDRDVLNFGEKISKDLKLQNFINFTQKDLSLNNVKDLPNADLVLCLNLIHHAGSLFDVDIVNKIGWERYSARFLSILKKKYKYAIIGVGFKSTKPANWPVIDKLRPIYFSKIIEKSGWKISYDANINDLVALGEEDANKRRTKRTMSIFLTEVLNFILGYKILKLLFQIFGPNENKPKIEKYHIYILN